MSSRTLILHRRIPLPALAALLLSACASQVPLLIRQAPTDSPSLVQVRAQVEDYVGQSVRWGGLLIATDNQEHASRLTVLAWPLGSDGKPRHSDDSDGRFIAIVPGFLDPAVYVANRLVTITGTLAHAETELVGEHPYAYPVVEAQAWYLWPESAASRNAYPYSGWYDPWYGPWWYSPWYDPWYSPGWYPYRDHYRRPHTHPKPVPDTDPVPDDPGDTRPHRRDRKDHKPDDRPDAEVPRKHEGGAKRPQREQRVEEHRPPAQEQGQERFVDQPETGRRPADDGDTGRGFRRFFRE
jgi:outer membrane lipoprotein